MAPLQLRVGQRYRTNNGCIVRIDSRQRVDRDAPDGWAWLCGGRCEEYADGTAADSHIPLFWFENGFYGAHADHPLTITEMLSSPVHGGGGPLRSSGGGGQ